MENFVTAVAYHISLNLPASFSQPGKDSFGDPFKERESERGGGGECGGGERGGHVAANNADRDRRDRDIKQTSYERRQSKLPPRLAKQKEQNRYSGTGTSSISSQEAWGPSSNERPVDNPVGTVAWDLMPPQQQQFGTVIQPQQPPPGPASIPAGAMAEFDTNRALLMQRFRNDRDGLTENPSALRLDQANLAVGGGGHVQPGVLTSNMDEAFTAESRENAVQTIIFENTNFLSCYFQ